MKTETEIPCPDCGGSGSIVDYVETTVCCRRPNEDGSCCGDGAIGYEPEEKQCMYCGATGRVYNHPYKKGTTDLQNEG